MKARGRRFDLIELVAVGLMVVLVTYAITTKRLAGRLNNYAVFGQDGLSELEPFERAYGPSKDSRNVEEWLIRDFFHDERGGVFVDIGANHYRNESNTYYLETTLGWSGIAVDAQAEFAEGYRLHRPRTRFFTFFISDVSGAQEEFFVPEDNKLVASADEKAAEREATGSVKRRLVPTISLSDLLDGEHISKVDFLTMDIELSEPKALAGFDVSRFKPRLVCVEAHNPVRQQILDYFAGHRYVIVGKYLRADPKNLYFTPIG